MNAGPIIDSRLLFNRRRNWNGCDAGRCPAHAAPDSLARLGDEVVNVRLYATRFVFLFSLLFGFQFVYLAHGDVVNNYPYITQDGFDWYMEGVYLAKLFSGASLPELPVLRPPLFVFLTAADYVAGGRGLILAIFYAVALFYTYFISLKIIDSAHEGGTRNSWYLVPLAIGTTVYPLNFIKPFLLADSLAVALSLFSVLLLVKYHIEEKLPVLALSVGISVVAFMTQTYALIPYAVSCAAGVLMHLRSNKNKAIKFLLAIFTTSVLCILCTTLWNWVLPHGGTPKNFELLKLSTHMLGFYISTWSYYFFPFILFFLLFRRHQTVLNATNFVVLLSATVVLLFAVLCFFYQWREARFTYYFWPWLMILFFSGIRLKGLKNAFLLSMLMLMMAVSSPATYWDPSWRSVRFTVFHNWVGDYFSALPIDRKLNMCGDDCEGKNEFLNKSDSYVNETITIYNKIKGL